MIIKHRDKTPKVHETAYVAPNAVVCGDVSIGKNVRVMFGAQLIAENSPIQIGDNCIILENAVLRGTGDHPLCVGSNCLVGPNTHLAGCTVEDEVFIATGASVFHGALLKKGAEVRVNGVVHLKTVVPENEIVPINWIAVGNPMQLFPPEKHNELWAVQQTLRFNDTVYGITTKDTTALMPGICTIMSDRLYVHKEDTILDD